ncbi:hypothetical protein OH799_21605 [Nocardia sp. NBC_00881]|uniref:hypothetical protein n=1 Tax=Nocardia sp. NBC_00881 TaxID=2975995 RepID=UPI00386813C1|nr:hypothetical protein OH799_21605 [Nocardia sp. NBC_00881]
MATRPMIAVAPTYQLNRWRMQPCNNIHISGLDHAECAATVHGGHGGCNLFIAAQHRLSAVPR